jgi:hypothetical protein
MAKHIEKKQYKSEHNRFYFNCVQLLACCGRILKQKKSNIHARFLCYKLLTFNQNLSHTLIHTFFVHVYVGGGWIWYFSGC